MVKKGKRENSKTKSATIKKQKNKSYNDGKKKNYNKKKDRNKSKEIEKKNKKRKKSSIEEKNPRKKKRNYPNQKEKQAITKQRNKKEQPQVKNCKKRKKKRKDNLLIALIFVVIILIINLFLLYQYQQEQREKEKIRQQEQIKLKKIQEKKEKEQLKDIIFLGDSITDFYDLDKYFDIPIINSGISGWTTDDILNNLGDKVFKYKPKKIFILIGTNDFRDGKEIDYVYRNIKEIVSQIRKKSRYTTIYIQSIYPVNNTDNKKIEHTMVGCRKNEDIIELNKKIKTYCNMTKNITYIDMFERLKDEEGNLKLEYTKEGLHISDKGYEVITDILKEYL